MAEYKITLATAEDLELLTKHRIGMWMEIRPELKKQAQELEGVTRDWIKRKMSEGKLIGFIAKTSTGTIVGSGCIWIKEEPPRLYNQRLESPYIMSMYTEPGFRRKGVARAVVQSAIDWCQSHGYNTVSLHAAEAGIPLYEAFGFKQTTEMRLIM